MTPPTPRLTLERALLRERPYVIALDEVGRGALAGPVAVGAVLLDERGARRRIPQGLRDSKLVTQARRPEVADRAASWASASAVGWASAGEIDEVGIIRALGLAAVRALAALPLPADPADQAVVVLDGNHDYVTSVSAQRLTVRTVVKADRDCASAAAASVIAKVARDRLMAQLHEDAPVYDWARNKGYASAEHRAAIDRHGLSEQHRASWAIGPRAGLEPLF